MRIDSVGARILVVRVLVERILVAMRKVGFFFLLLLGTAGCVVASGLSDVGSGWRLRHTRLCLRPDFDSAVLHGRAALTLRREGGVSDRVCLDARGMGIVSVGVSGFDGRAGAALARYSYDGSRLRVDLGRALAGGDSVRVLVDYVAVPDDPSRARGHGSGLGRNGLHFAGRGLGGQVWMRGGSRCLYPTLDSLSARGGQRVEITVPCGMVTLSNGLLVDSARVGDSLRRDTWALDLGHAPHLSFFAAGDLAVVRDAPWRGVVPMAYYVDRGYVDLASGNFGVARGMLDFFSDYFGVDYPWPSYNQIALRDFMGDGMVSTTAVPFPESSLLSEGSLSDRHYWEGRIARGVAHHWFGNLVTVGRWGDLALQEGIATYGAYLWMSHRYGILAAEAHRYEGLLSYLHSGVDFEKRAIRDRWDSDGDLFDNVSYHKGAAIAHMLRDYLGDSVFRLGLGRLLRDRGWGVFSVDDARVAFEGVSGRDLGWFFSQWYYKSGHPRARWDRSYDSDRGELTLRFQQGVDGASCFAFPLEVDVYTELGVTRHSVWVDSVEESRFTLAVGGEPLLVDVNPRGVVLLEEMVSKSQAEYSYQYGHARDFKSRYQALRRGVGPGIALMALRDSSDFLRCEALSRLDVLPADRVSLSLVEGMARADESHLARAGALRLLAGSRRTRYLPLYRRALSEGSSALRNAAIYGIARCSPKDAKTLLVRGTPDGFSMGQLVELAPAVVRYRQVSYLPSLIGYMSQYALLEEDGRDEEMRRVLREGFEWAMGMDDMSLVEGAIQPLLEMLPYLKDDSLTRLRVRRTLEHAISVKGSVRQTESIRSQLSRLEEALRLVAAR